MEDTLPSGSKIQLFLEEPAWGNDYYTVSRDVGEERHKMAIDLIHRISHSTTVVIDTMVCHDESICDAIAARVADGSIVSLCVFHEYGDRKWTKMGDAFRDPRCKLNSLRCVQCPEIVRQLQDVHSIEYLTIEQYNLFEHTLTTLPKSVYFLHIDTLAAYLGVWNGLGVERLSRMEVFIFDGSVQDGGAELSALVSEALTTPGNILDSIELRCNESPDIYRAILSKQCKLTRIRTRYCSGHLFLAARIAAIQTFRLEYLHIRDKLFQLTEDDEDAPAFIQVNFRPGWRLVLEAIISIQLIPRLAPKSTSSIIRSVPFLDLTPNIAKTLGMAVHDLGLQKFVDENTGEYVYHGGRRGGRSPLGVDHSSTPTNSTMRGGDGDESL